MWGGGSLINLGKLPELRQFMSVMELTTWSILLLKKNSDFFNRMFQNHTSNRENDLQASMVNSVSSDRWLFLSQQWKSVPSPSQSLSQEPEKFPKTD